MARPLAEGTILEGNIVQQVTDLQRIVSQLQARSVHVQYLSQISPNLGLVEAGGFVAGLGSPYAGDLTGVAMISDSVLGPDGRYYNLVGMNNGTLMFGLSAEDGRAYFAGGSSTIDSVGITINGLNRLLQLVAENAGASRAGYFQMKLADDGTTPVLSIGYENAGTTEKVTNPGFETGQLSPEWTNDADVSVVGSVYYNLIERYPRSGNFMVVYKDTTTSREVHSATRFTVSAGASYRVQCWARHSQSSGGKGIPAGHATATLKVRFYDAVSGGTLLSTVTVGYTSGLGSPTDWQNIVGTVIAPAGATHAEVQLAFSANVLGHIAMVDDVSMVQLTGYAEINLEPGLFLRGDASIVTGKSQSTPSAPPAGYWKLWGSSVDNKLYAQTPSGEIYPLGGGGGSSRFKMLPAETEFLDDTTPGLAPYTGGPFGSGNFTGIEAEANHPGIVRITNGGVANGGGRAALTGNISAVLLEGGEVFECVFRVHSLATQSIARLGFMDSFGVTTPTDGAYFYVVGDGSSGIWIYPYTYSNGSSSSPGAWSTITSLPKWICGKIIVNADATQIDYHLYNENGTEFNDGVKSITTNIPKGTGRGLSVCATGYRTNATTTTILDLDWMSFSSTKTLVR